MPPERAKDFARDRNRSPIELILTSEDVHKLAYATSERSQKIVFVIFYEQSEIK